MKRLALIALLALILTSGSATAQDPVMWRFQAVTGFIGTGTEADPNRPAIGDAYALSKWEDVTGLPSAAIMPEPNTYVVQAEAAESVLDSIEGDNSYLVLWAEEITDDEELVAQAYELYDLLGYSDDALDIAAREAAGRIISRNQPVISFFAVEKKQEKRRDGVPDANEFGQIRSYLARQGVKQAQITAVIGTGANGRSRGEIAGLLREWMKTLEKGAR